MSQSTRSWASRVAAAAAVALLAVSTAAASELFTARQGHTATLLPDGTVLVAGGDTVTGPTASVEIVDPALRSSMTTSPMLEPRAWHTATLLDDGRVLLVGGRGPAGALATTEIYDPASGSFVAGPSLNAARAGHTATVLESGAILLAGGDGDRRAEIYDPAAGTFVLLEAEMIHQRARHGAVLLDTGSVLLAGGVDGRDEPLDSAEVFVPETASFEPVRGWMHAPRVRPRLVVLFDGKVQILGGDGAGTFEVFRPHGRYFRAQVDPAIAAPILAAGRTAPTAANADAAGRGLRDLSRRDDRSTPGAVPAPMPAERPSSAAVDVPGRGVRIVIGGADAAGAPVAAIDWISTTDARVSADRLDYSATMSPVLEGRGFEPGEPIAIYRQPAYPAGAAPHVLAATADDTGAFASTDLGPADHEPGMTWLVTAIGLTSQRVAQTAYYDAPDLGPNRESLPPGPFRVRIEVPISGEPGSAETEIGTLRWNAWTLLDEGRSGTRLFDGSFDLSTVPIPDSGWEICQDIGNLEACLRLLELTGVIHVAGDIVAEFDIDAGCIPCGLVNPQCWDWVPCASCCDRWPWQCDWHCEWYGCWPTNCGCKGTPACWGCGRPGCCDCDWEDILPEVRALGGGAALDVSADPEIAALLGLEVEASVAVPVPGLGAAGSFTVGGIISGDLTLGLILTVSAGIEDTSIRVTADPELGVDVGAYYRSSTGFDVGFCQRTGGCTFSFDTGAELVTLGQGYVKLSVGPEISVEATIAEVVDFGVGAGVRDYVQATLPLDPLFVRDECVPWQIDLDTGVEAWAEAGAHVFTLGWSGEVIADLWGPVDVLDVYGTGEILVHTATLGTDRDRDGYEVRIVRSDPGAAPAWGDALTAALGPDDSHRFEGGFCWSDVFTGIHDCALVATEHDVELDGVHWNCTASSPSVLGTCAAFDAVTEVTFEVGCRSVFVVLEADLDELLATGSITDPTLARRLGWLLDRADEARNPLLPSAGETPALVARDCAQYMEAFGQVVESARGSGIAAPAATLLLDRAADVAAHWCAVATPGRRRL